MSCQTPGIGRHDIGMFHWYHKGYICNGKPILPHATLKPHLYSKLWWSTQHFRVSTQSKATKKQRKKKKKHPEAKTKECWCYCCCLRRGDGTQLLHLWPSNPEQRTCKPIPKKPTHMNVKWIQSDAKPTEFMKPVKVRWTTVYQKNQGTSLKTHAVHDGATFFGLTCCSCAKSKPLLFFW